MSAYSTEAAAELAMCCRTSIGHLVDNPEESVVHDALSSGKVSEESIASKQNAALGLGQREGKAVGLRECRVTTLVGQSEDLASGIEFDDLEAKGRKVGLKLGTQFECVHLIGDNELPGETEERLKQAPPFEIQQDGGVGDDDDHGPVVL